MLISMNCWEQCEPSKTLCINYVEAKTRSYSVYVKISEYLEFYIYSWMFAYIFHLFFLVKDRSETGWDITYYRPTNFLFLLDWYPILDYGGRRNQNLLLRVIPESRSYRLRPSEQTTKALTIYTEAVFFKAWEDFLTFALWNMDNLTFDWWIFSELLFFNHVPCLKAKPIYGEHCFFN